MRLMSIVLSGSGECNPQRPKRHVASTASNFASVSFIMACPYVRRQEWSLERHVRACQDRVNSPVLKVSACFFPRSFGSYLNMHGSANTAIEMSSAPLFQCRCMQ
jgi:hypothetical protein